MGVDSLDVRVFWPSTHASIPADWSRDTAFDEKFLQGDDSNYAGPANAGGSHEHTDTGHTHTGNQHRHTFTGASAMPAVTTIKQGSGRADLAAFDPTWAHSHGLGYGAYQIITYQNEIVTIDTEDAMPPYMKLIVIKPDLVTKDIPDDAVCYTDETVLPTGFAKYAAIDDNFVRAPADGQDAALGGFGAATHDHDSPAGSHDHDIDVHGHDFAASGPSNPSLPSLMGAPTTTVLAIRHHDVGMANQALSDLTATEVVVAATSSEPAYIKLLGIQNTSGAATTPVGVIVAFVGAAGTVPSNWQICDGNGDTIDCRDKQIWSTAADGEIGDTGGSNTHTHTITGTHNHTHGAHNHSTGGVNMSGARERTTGSPTENVIPQIGGIHTHTWTINNATPTMQAASVTLSGTEDVRSAYRTVIWIKKLIERPGPKALLGTTF